MSKANLKEKEEKTIQVPLSVIIERTTEKVINDLNESQLDIHLKIEVLQNVLQLAVNTEQQERANYEEQLKELEEKENAKSQEKSK